MVACGVEINVLGDNVKDGKDGVAGEWCDRHERRCLKGVLKGVLEGKGV